MNDPQIHSSTWDWDSASTAEAWKHSHNYVHHTYTNIRGKDNDLGYEIMRIDPHQKWHPVYLLQPFYNLVLAAFFEWGVAFHDLDFEAIRKGEKSKEQLKRELKGMAARRRQQIVKDYLAFPAAHRRAGRRGACTPASQRAPAAVARERAARRAAPPARAVADGRARWRVRETFRSTLTADFTANVIRNVWAYAIIFCGHFPDQTYTFSQEEVEDEIARRLLRAPAARRRQHRGQPALPRRQRQPRLPGRAPPLPRHAEHPLRRDRPAREGRSASATSCPTTPARSCKQLGSVQRTILRLALPGRQAAARSPAPTAATAPTATRLRRRHPRRPPRRRRAGARPTGG